MNVSFLSFASHTNELNFLLLIQYITLQTSIIKDRILNVERVRQMNEIQLGVRTSFKTSFIHIFLSPFFFTLPYLTLPYLTLPRLTLFCLSVPYFFMIVQERDKMTVPASSRNTVITPTIQPAAVVR